MQDPALMQATRERCRYLTDFLNGVVAPLQKSAADPFYGYSVDINALGLAPLCTLLYAYVCMYKYLCLYVYMTIPACLLCIYV